MTPNIGVCTQGHIWFVDHSLPLTGWANRPVCPECGSFLYDGEQHPHLLHKDDSITYVCGGIGACGHPIGDGLDMLFMWPDVADRLTQLSR